MRGTIFSSGKGISLHFSTHGLTVMVAGFE
jgi:hypothetical protein